MALGALPVRAKVLLAVVSSGASIGAFTACGAAPGEQSATPSASIDAAVKVDYLRFWDVFLMISADGKAPLRRLDAVAAGPFAVELRHNLRRSRAAGVVSAGSVEHDITAATRAGQSARLVDCVDLNGWTLRDVSTGRDHPGQMRDRPRQLVEYVLSRGGGRWMVTKATEAGTC